jgi:hypothetical protein
MPSAGRWRWWPLVGLVIVIGAAASVLVAVAVAKDRGQVSDVVQAVTSVLVPTCGLALWLWTRRRRESPMSADALTRAVDALAEAVRDQWEAAAGERRLRHPAPVPVRWRWSRRGVTGPVDEALGGVGQARFAPLPGMAAATMATVDDGELGDLVAVYGGLDSGRMILLGGAGTGKSAAAILTVLDALTHRQSLDDAQRARVPVPVLLTAHGWDPHRQRLSEWLAARLTAEYPFLRANIYGHDVAARLVNGGRVALVLDGFDEIADDLRPVALRALDEQATFRLMVLTRTSELIDAVGGGHLHGAAALELLPVSAKDAADYLIRCQVQPSPPAWERLAEHLRAAPDSVVSTALDNPLMLTLVRDTFATPAEVDGLLAPGRFTSRAEVEGYLLDRVLPAAYRPRPGDRPPLYSCEHAARWLGYLATEMNHRDTRDLAWWRIYQWAPAPIRALILGLPSALGLGSTTGPLVALLLGLPAGVAVGIVAGSVYGVAIGVVLGRREGNLVATHRGKRPRWKAAAPPTILEAVLVGGLASGLGSGIAAGITVGIARAPAAGVAIGLATAGTFGLASGTLQGLMQARRRAGPHRLKQLRWSTVVSRANVGVALGFGALFGLAFGFGLTFGLDFGPSTGVSGGLAMGVVSGLLYALVSGLVQTSAVTGPMDPVTCWRNDRRSGIVDGLAHGFLAALMLALVGWLVGGIDTAIALAIAVAPGTGLAFTLSASQAWIATQGFFFLGFAGLFPRQGIRFLEDARQRGVLRTVGSVYQFRHARLQDQLAATYPIHPRTQ